MLDTANLGEGDKAWARDQDAAVRAEAAEKRCTVGTLAGGRSSQ